MAYKQAQNRKKHLLKTYNETKNWYGAGVYFVETCGRIEGIILKMAKSLIS